MLGRDPTPPPREWRDTGRLLSVQPRPPPPPPPTLSQQEPAAEARLCIFFVVVLCAGSFSATQLPQPSATKQLSRAALKSVTFPKLRRSPRWVTQWQGPEQLALSPGIRSTVAAAAGAAAAPAAASGTAVAG